MQMFPLAACDNSLSVKDFYVSLSVSKNWNKGDNGVSHTVNVP